MKRHLNFEPTPKHFPYHENEFMILNKMQQIATADVGWICMGVGSDSKFNYHIPQKNFINVIAHVHYMSIEFTF